MKTIYRSMCVPAFLFLLLTWASLPATDIEEGSVSGTWGLEDSPYLVHGDIDIPEGSTLEIEAGVDIYFDNFASLTVAGALLAFGTEEQMITFSATNEQLGWEGIKINSSDPTVFEYCTFERGSAPYGGAIYIGYGAKVDIAGCLFESNSSSEAGGAIYSDDTSQLKIINSEFIENYTSGFGGAVSTQSSCLITITGTLFAYNTGSHGGGLHTRSSGTAQEPVLIANNEFKCNEALYGNQNIHPHGGGLFAYGGHSIIEGNVFLANTSIKSGGGIYAESCSRIDIINNVVYNNEVTMIGTGGGIEIMKRCKGILMGNLVFENISPYCAGVSLEECDMHIINNTICNNTADELGGGLSFLAALFTADMALVYNNILWGNEPDQIFAEGYLESIIIDNCNLQGGVGAITGDHEWVTIVAGDNNLDEDPRFVDSQTYYYALGADSPCIDAGYDGIEGIEWPELDLYGRRRIINDIIDIGACEFDPTSVPAGRALPKGNTIELSNSPNPFNPVTNITFDLPEAAHCKLTVYNVKGQLITTLIDAPQSAGPHTITWDGKDSSGRGVASGIYLYRLEAGNSVITRKMVVVK